MNIIESYVCLLWKPIDFLDNAIICFCCQVLQIWLLIQRVVGSMVGG